MNMNTLEYIKDSSQEDDISMKPGNPRWIFFDDEQQASDPVEAWFKAEMERFEEWNVTKALAHLPSARISRYIDPVSHQETFCHEDAYEEPVSPQVESWSQRMEALKLNNWIFRKKTEGWEDDGVKILQKAAMRIAAKGDDEMLEVASVILKACKAVIKRAPDPMILGTIFLNPDGVRYVTKGTNPYTAKTRFMQRHGLEAEFVAIEKIQKEGENGAWWVIGVRGHSDKRKSHYIDMQPAFKDVFLNGKWEHQYDPNAAITLQEWESDVIPEGAYRLTVRDFERALIAGANIADDEYSAINFGETRYDQVEEDFDDLRERGSYNEYNHDGDARKIMEEDLTDEELLIRQSLEMCSSYSENFIEEQFYKQFAVRMLYLKGRNGYLQDLTQEIENIDAHKRGNGEPTAKMKMMRAIKAISDDPDTIEKAVKLIDSLSEDQDEIEQYSSALNKRLKDAGIIAR